MPERSTSTKDEFLHEDAPEIDPPLCEVCRAQLWLPSDVSLPGEGSKALLMCEICYFDGVGQAFITSHHPDIRKLVVWQRVDGEEPQTPDGGIGQEAFPFVLDGE